MYDGFYPSTGNKQKLNILLAFLGDPKLLILDEPTEASIPYGRRFCDHERKCQWILFHDSRADQSIFKYFAEIPRKRF